MSWLALLRIIFDLEEEIADDVVKDVGARGHSDLEAGIGGPSDLEASSGSHSEGEEADTGVHNKDEQTGVHHELDEEESGGDIADHVDVIEVGY